MAHITSGIPRLINTPHGTVSIETQIMGGNNARTNNTVPIIDIRVTIEPGNVDDPEILFKLAIDNAYALARQQIAGPPSPEDQVRLVVEHDGLTKNHGHWSTKTYQVQDCLKDIVDDWNLAMQSGESVNLTLGSFTVIAQFVLSKPPDNNHANVRVGAGYQDRKQKMWMRTDLNQCFINSNGLLYIPTTIEKLCFPMAFITAQCRILKKNVITGAIIDIEETQPCELWNHLQPQNPNYFHIRLADTHLCTRLQEHLPQFIHNHHLVLFNPHKRKIRGRGNDVVFVKDQFATIGSLDLFVQIAKLVHEYVETAIGKLIDVNNLEEVAKAYCEVFQVHIHIRRFETQGNENQVFLALNKPESERHVALMLTSMEDEYDHCHSVTNIREWCKSKQSANRSNITSYCDYCTMLKTSNHCTKSKSLQHLNSCRLEYFQNKGIKKMKLQSSKPAFFQDKNGGYICNHCYVKEIQDVNTHQCHSPYPDTPSILDESKLFVFDIEAAQEQTEENDNLYVHHANLVCIRSVYSTKIREEFSSIDLFMRYILHNPEFQGYIILAHNGGSYDCQFILQYLERNLIEFTLLPRPGSIHKYLELIIKGKTVKDDITFKDFIVFMPGSLKNIAKAFQLPISNGDFPHRFNCLTNYGYIGPIPPLHSEKDYYCLRTKKDQKDILEIEEWHNTQLTIYCSCPLDNPCICLKRKWDFQKELKKYCWLDCDVLAESVKKFRDAHLQFGEEADAIHGWTPSRIDPFTFSTKSQVAMTFFLHGHLPSNMPAISTIKHKSGWSKESVL